MASDTPTDPPITASQQRIDQLLSTLAEHVGARCTASTVFGVPVTNNGVTVIPVARSRFVFGGGGGSDPAKGQNGEGGGGAGVSAPVGYIELKGDRTRFVPAVRRAPMAACVGAGILAVGLIVRLGLAARKA
jgi:uncharacterized spore protein YtfJ